MEIQIEIEYPAILEELSTAEDHNAVFLNYKGQDYGFVTKFGDNSTLFILTTNIIENEIDLSPEIKERMANHAIEIVNRSINRIRTFHHEKTYFYLVSPRTVEKVKLIYPLETESITELIVLQWEMPEFVKVLYDYLNEEEHRLTLSEKLELDQATFLQLTIDSYYNLIEGNFNECIINCSTALESLIFPILQGWLTERLFHKNERTAQTILMDISMANKYELLFGTVESDFLANHGKLLEILKGTNKLRNSIIHSGYRANRQEAEKALNYSAKLIVLIFLKFEDVD
ncbi:hypothetical protein V1387_08775 [Allomuricauda taeanensis]|uniref:hypothetical protein n=1 Tax=Flagellimonas taeanensis TaxID=1005926 RepID=UPI002E7B2FD2|nr:hypothetical protein [Allomuricauda taeanensis]MEE1962774.1 hypothetical protein [Allomuricauda taeanensis]